MDTRALRLLARGAAMTAALGALVAAPAQADAASLKKKRPIVTSVTPLTANVGDTLKIRGKYFRLGKGKNSVVFRRDNSPAIFVKADISTKKVMSVVLPKRLEDYMAVSDGVKRPTKFRIRILARRLGKKYTRLSKSPTIGPEIPKGAEPEEPAGPPPAEGDCDGDGTLNGADGDDDNDLLDDALEVELKTDQCKSDTDGDGIGDAYEYKSAIDLNDDEFQQPNESLPYPRKQPYPNPLDASDANADFDGDGLTLGEEWDLWVYVGDKSLFPLSYSDGEQYSINRRCTTGDSDPRCGAGDENRRIPTLAAAGYSKHEDFRAWTAGAGYDQVRLTDAPPWYDHVARNEYDLFDMNRNGSVATENDLAFEMQTNGLGVEDFYLYSERYYYDTDDDGYLKDGERDEDADGLTNYDELHSRMTLAYWNSCYADENPYNRPFGAVSHVDADSDGDGVRDGADDQDHDDVPNVMELSRNAASGLFDGAGQCNKLEGLPEPPDTLHPEVYGWVNPYDPCLPDRDSRTCSHNYPFDNIPNPFNADVLEWASLN